ncbi:unnamed protein product, partial [Oppiella nova]
MVNESECETKAEESVALKAKDVEELALDFGYYETTIDVEEGVVNPELPAKFTIFGYRPSQIKWSNVIFLSVMHVLAVYAYLHSCFNPVHLFTLFFVIFISSFSGFGMSVGGHRYWSHRTFKARLPLQIILAILQTMTVNGSILSYSRDHRNHHKWPATHADPKNPGRGFFFAHIGWWLLKKRPEVMLYGKKVPVDDLINDPIVYYQHKFYIPLVILLAYVFPTLVPVLSWKEDILTAFLVCSCLRTVVVLHHLFTVNSVAHFLGHRPYDRFMKPTENKIINWISMGEGNHNYHHTFPWDYSNSEKTWYEIFNPATLFIDICKLIGLAYDLKKPSQQTIDAVIERKGLPEYFAADKTRNLCLKITFGFIDWIFGILFAKWPVWTIIIIK